MADSIFHHIFFLTGTGTSVLSAAVCLDLVFGDRENLPHPIRLMGAAINASEKMARASLLSEPVAGAAMTLILVGGTYLSALILFTYLSKKSFLLFFVLSVAAIYFCISIRCLADEALKVFNALEAGDLEKARDKIARLVSRDTKEMTEEDISRAAVETVAENFVDGIVSPFFYAALGGPALCLCFKMISTLDSMIGYKNDTYFDFGRLAARLDDAANFIPARLFVPVIALCSMITGSNPARVFSCVFACGRLHESPNSGFPESAFAAALNAKLGGSVSYFGETRDCPVLNRHGQNPCARHIRQAVLLLYACSLLSFSIFLITGLFFTFR